ncbi:helix-turn-helix domain-containing protein [Lacticaseibacillus zhaodongensis]|uniref:helix-turn-helix domain-containing protein n=1 Tax=Lacticaseibacillus zhaodongensis TaxID=2668065 RepID=UPI0012D3303D|nr:helix-turn-helix domain-containing protein [Lacticaseibacillus zhaodongensis]
MTRSMTYEERVKIVKYCLANGRHLTATAAKFNVTYQQVRSWVVKYEAGGEEALRDMRGHHKTDDQLTEVERLRRETARLERAIRDEKAIRMFREKLEALEEKGQ